MKYELIERVGMTAEWRQRKAEQYPGDRRNEEAAKDLLALGRKLEAVPSDDPRLVEIAGCWAWPISDRVGLELSEMESEKLRLIGFHSSYQSAEDFLDDMLKGYREIIARHTAAS